MADQRYLVYVDEPNDHYVTLGRALTAAQEKALTSEGTVYLVRQATVYDISEVETGPVTSITRSLLNNLWGYWNCDDASSTTLTDSHSSNDLSINTTWNTDPSGLINSARDTNAFGYRASGTGPDWIRFGFSWSGWFDPGGANNFGEICGVTDGTTTYSLEFNGNTDVIIVSTGDSDAAAGAGSTDYSHYVLTWDGSLLKCYIDGGSPVIKSPSAYLGDLVTIFIGSADGGLTDEWAFWPRAITDDEVSDLYNSGAGLAYGSF